MGGGQAGLGHGRDHAVNAVAQPFHEAQVGEGLDDGLVAGEAFVQQVVEGHVAGQAAGAVDLHVVAEHQHPDALAADGVVAVGHRIDDGFAHDRQRVFGGLLAGEALDAHPTAHVGGDERFSLADLVGQRATRIVAHELIPHRAGRRSASG